MTQQEKLFLAFGLGAVALWLWFTRSGQAAAASAGGFLSTALVNLQDSTLRLIANFEGFSPTPYRDAGGWSIGYGHYMGPSPTMDSISQPDAYNLLSQDASNAAQAVNNNVQVPLTQNQYDALVSLTYNIGVTAFFGSTLLRKLNAGDVQGAADEFMKWTHSQGQILQALVDRRTIERETFLS